MKIVNVVGARPNFVKMAPLLAAQRAHSEIVPLLIHTGQHGDELLTGRLFAELDLPMPDVRMDLEPAPAAAQYARIFDRLRAELRRIEPARVLVVGDVTSTVAAAAAAQELGIPLAHVEAGLRCGDMSMLEEQNRIRTDQMSDLLFASEPSAVANLSSEGANPVNVHLVGNVMIDTLVRCRDRAARLERHRALGLEPRRYAVVTLHRRGNLDDARTAAELIEAVDEVAKRIHVVFPAHPRARAALEASGGLRRAVHEGRLTLLPPQSYLEMVSLTMSARVVATDSGGLQEETSYLGIPCLTLRDHTERPLTITDGTNRIAGRTTSSILRALEAELASDVQRAPGAHTCWDGRAAERIAAILVGPRGNDGACRT